MNRLIWAAAIAILLSACGSAVKLDDVPVEDKAGTSVSKTDGKDGAGVGQRAVTGVALDNAQSTAAMMATNRTVYFDYDSSSRSSKRMRSSSRLTRVARSLSKATPMNAVDVSTTWLWDRNGRKQYGAPWVSWVLQKAKSKRLVSVRKNLQC